MSKNILLISAQAVKDRSHIHKNMDEALILPEIKAAQDVHIRDALGSMLFDRLVTASNPDASDAMTTIERDFIRDYLTDALVWFTVAALPITSSHQLTTKGAVQRTDDNAQPLSIGAIRETMDFYTHRAQHYLQRAVSYLRANKTLFPLFAASVTGDGVRPSEEVFTSPFAFGDDDETCY